MMQTKPMLSSTTHPTPVGELTLVASDAGLRAILSGSFPSGRYQARSLAVAEART